jgi:GNAT superfamily N-acetyltransferase
MIVYRVVRSEDAAVICDHRRRMFAEMGTDAGVLDAASDSFAIWLEPRLADGRYFGFMAEDEGAVVAGVGLYLYDWPPGPLHSASDRRALVLNVYVEPVYRGRGIATELMRWAEAELERRGVAYATLAASAAGRPVYERLGWAATTEMAKALG